MTAGSDIAALPESKLPHFRAGAFGFVVQDFNLLGALTARENVEFALNLAGVTGKRAHLRAEKLLEGFGLASGLRLQAAQTVGRRETADRSCPSSCQPAAGDPGRRHSPFRMESG